MIIKIDDISINCVVGVYPNEKNKKRQILVSLKIDFDFNGSDEISSTIDYDGIVNLLKNLITQQNFNLIESICQACGEAILKFNDNIKFCTVEVKKPFAVLDAAMTSVIMTFEKQ